MSELTSQFEEIVLRAETNPFRFERLCIDAVGAAEGGVAVVGTSTSWDLGRDGVGLGRGEGLYLCTSLRDDVDAKAFSDIERITSTTARIRTLYFCSSQSLTEHRIELLRSQLEDETDRQFPVRVIGADQIIELARRENGLFQKYYGAEIKDLLDRITAPDSDEDIVRGLRLSLLSATADESHEIRRDVYQNALLEALAHGDGKTAQRCATEISEQLLLARPINIQIVHQHLSDLVSGGFATKLADVYRLTDAGTKKRTERTTEAASNLVAGRNAIKASLEESIGAEIAHYEFDRIWSVFQDRMADYFQSRGEQIVSEITNLLISDEAEEQTPEGPLSFLDDFATAVALTSSNQQRREELKQAIKDLFSDKQGEAAKWLVRVCAAFVMTCTLGLEHSSAQALTSILKKTSIALDTDVLLSLVGEAEPDHVSVEAIVRNWRQAGGSVLVAAPVLEEAAYHAHIAQRDYDEVHTLLPGTPSDRLHIIENVFVRSFAELLTRREAQKRDWQRYISQFKGRTEHDFTGLFSYLNSEYGLKRLPERSSALAPLAKEVNAFLIEMLESQTLRVDKNTRDKAARDAELYTGLVQYIEQAREFDPAATCVLVSSARRLMRVDAQFRQSGERQLVISISSAAYLVALLPNARLGLNAMKAFLFDETRSRFSSDLERTVLRMLKASREHQMPFAKRSLLMKELRGRLLEGAEFREKGSPRQSAVDVERAALRPENHRPLAEALAQALDAVAVDSRTERENRALRAENDKLKRQLERRR